MDTSTKGILKPKDIDEQGRYYFVRKAMDAGDVVRLKNGLYATKDTHWCGQPLNREGEQMCNTRFVDFLPQKFGGVKRDT